jgi:hypothetical protein
MNQTPKTGSTARKIVSGGTVVRIPVARNMKANNSRKGGGGMSANDVRMH